ncbi:MAG: radical SAM protein [Oscillospiraceae bacterium]|jgi:wyosine [tRNA(Phe)-imidazoG37] synthetase (radical SAM superfamily)|nr:radical SAM protein [Oscillospiraceae bacterium]
MKDYVKIIADKINAGIPIIFYALGSGMFLHIKELKVRFNLLPTAVCDGDIKKQGIAFKGLEGLFVMSPSEAVKIENSEIYVTTLDYRYEIFAYLTDKLKVSPERIINYVPVKKVRSCNFLQKCVIYDRDDAIRFCWRKQGPRIYSSEEKLDIENVVKTKNELLKKIEVSNEQGTDCENCLQICEKHYAVEPSPWCINFFCKSKCNFKCSYCTLINSNKKSKYSTVNDTGNSEGLRPLTEILSEFRKADSINEAHSIVLSTAGEPFLHPKLSKFVDEFDGYEFCINTNGSIFNEHIFEMMNRKRIFFTVSIDSGTKETFERVKGVNAFEKVKSNLMRYSNAKIGFIALKYTFVPGVNDNEEDIDGFVDFVQETGGIFVILSLDYYSVNKITEYTKSQAKRLKSKLSKINIMITPYTMWETSEYIEAIKELFNN